MCSANEGGFTLIEVLVTVVIMSIISVGLVGVVISYFKTSVDARSRFTESFSLQLAATYWQRDVASIGIRGYDDDPDAEDPFPLLPSVGVDPVCTVPRDLTEVVTLGWSNYDSTVSTEPPLTVTVTYGTREDDQNSGSYDLYRIRCDEGTPDPTENSRVANSLADLPDAPVCAPEPDCGAAGQNLPQTIDLTLAIADPDGNGAPTTTTLTGKRRQS